MKTLSVIILALIFATAGVRGATEYVLVVKVFGDKGIIERRNGEQWIIEKGVGALSFWRYEGKRAVIQYPGIFGGVGSALILPDVQQEARIWSAERIESGAPQFGMPAPQVNPSSDAKAIFDSLIFLGYYDPKSADPQKRNIYAALAVFQKAHGIERLDDMTATKAALAAEIVRKTDELNRKAMQSPRR